MAFFQLSSKAKTAFLIYFRIAIAWIVVYSALDYAIFLRPGYISVREDWPLVWLPMLLPIIPLWIWLRPHLRQLTFRKRRGDPVFGLLLLATFAAGVPTVLAQSYLTSATGSLEQLRTMGEIRKVAPARYYTVAGYRIDKQHPGIFYLMSASGKGQRDLDLDLYIACPVFSDSSPVEERLVSQHEGVVIDSFQRKGPLFVLNGRIVDSAVAAAIPRDSIARVNVLKGPSAITIFGLDGARGVVLITTKAGARDTRRIDTVRNLPIPDAWICVKFHQQISNTAPVTEKEQKAKAFSFESMGAFQKTRLAGFTYLRRLPNNTARDYYARAVNNIWPSVSAEKMVLLEPVYQPFSERNGNKLMWVFVSLVAGTAIMWMLMLAVVSKQALNAEGQVPEPESIRESLQFWMPRKGFYATPVIVYLNMLVFISMVISGKGFIHFNTADLLKWGANSRTITMHGQWWRLVTCTFLHGGFMHLMLNMYGLLFAGVFLEPVLGTKRFGMLYLLCGIVASVASITWYRAVVSVGASGAIFGMYGVFIALLIANVFHASLKKSFLVNLVIFVVINLLYGLTGGTDNAAHIGGLLSGFVAGFVAAPWLKKDNTPQADINED